MQLKKKLPYLVFAIALVVRIWNFGSIEFKLDEALTIFRSSNIWLRHQLPAGGLIASFGGRNPPLFLYLVSIFTVMSGSPLLITFFFAVAGSLTVAITYLLVSYLTTPLSGLLSSLLLAFSPWAIVFSRKIWAQNLLPLFSALILLSIYRLTVNKNRRWFIPLVVFSLWSIQIHFSAVILLPGVFYLIWINRQILYQVSQNKPPRDKSLGTPTNLGINGLFRSDPRWTSGYNSSVFCPDSHRGFQRSWNKLSRDLIIGLIIGLVPLIPYLLLQLNNDFSDLLLFFQKNTVYSWHNLVNPFFLGTGYGFTNLLGFDYQNFLSRYPLLVSRKIMFIEPLLVLVGLIVSLRKKTFSRQLGLCFIFLLGLLFVSGQPAVPFYEETFFPFVYIFLGVLIGQLIDFGKPLKILTLAVIILIVTIKVIYVSSFYCFISDEKQINGDYGLIFSEKEKLVRQATQNFRGHPLENQVLTTNRLIYSIYYLNKKDNQYQPQENLIPVVEYELKQKLDLKPVTL